jgi:hypothetical protein
MQNRRPKGYRLFSAVDLRSDGPDQTKREGERTVGCLQWPDSGAMAEKTETSPKFTVLAIPANIRQTKSTGRE